MRSLFGKKVLIAIILLVSVGVALAAYNYFYTWTKYYKIKPLTSIEKIKFQTSGATIGIAVDYTDADTGGSVCAVPPLVIVPYSVPPGIEITLTCFLAPQLPPGWTIKMHSDVPPGIEITIAEANKTLVEEFGYNGSVLWGMSPTPRPVYHETLNLDKKCYVNFAVSSTDIEKLVQHFVWLIEIEYIFHPGSDGILGTDDDYLYAIVLIPLVNPWQRPGSGFARILLSAGEYGVIKTTCYWTKAATQEVSHNFTIHIWAQEYETTRPPS